jgi:excisionase family DNA binding protein
MKLLTVKAVAEMLSLSQSRVYEMAGKELRCYRIGGAIRFSEEQVMEYLSSCVVEVTVEPQRRVALPRLKHLRL